MLQLIYILVFTLVAFVAIRNLIRSLVSVSAQVQRQYDGPSRDRRREWTSLHPELLDEEGKPLDEPLLVMRSISVEDAREQLDELFRASPEQRFRKSDEDLI